MKTNAPAAIAVSLTNVRVGDILTRMLGATIPMQVKVTRVDAEFVYCATPDGKDAWTFERTNGLEFDPELRWGSQFGVTGSFISEVTRPH